MPTSRLGRDRVEPRALISGNVTLHAEESAHVLAPLRNERSRPDVLAVVHGTVHCGDRFLDNRFGLFSRRLVGLLTMGLLHVSCGTYAKRCIRKEAPGCERSQH
jgi:hypothetical protein